MRYFLLAVAIVLIGNWSIGMPKEVDPDTITVVDNIYSVGVSSTDIYNMRAMEMQDKRDFDESVRRFNVKAEIEMKKAELAKGAS